MAALHATPAWAETSNTYYVSTGGNSPDCATAANNSSAPFGTIQAALTCAADDAASASNPDTIQISAGTYDENDVIETNVDLIGAGATTTIVDGTGSGTVVTVDLGFTVGVSGFTLQHGASVNGGGINNNGTLTVSSVWLSTNSASNEGGGIWNAGTVTATDDTLSNNISSDVGGGIANGGILTATDDTFSDNYASLSAGGIWSQGSAVTATDDTFSVNSAGDWGGGMYIHTGTLTAINDTFTGNHAPHGGGGMWNDTTVTVTDDTFSGNSAPFGSGIWSQANAIVADTILANNQGGNCIGTITDHDHNISYPPSDTSCPGTFGNGDPALGPLQDNGGSTQTMAITPSSSAFEEVPAASCTVSTDQRGDPRPGVPGANCDAGAFEYQEYTVTFDPNGGSGTMADETENAPAALTTNTFTRTGYAFGGWNTASDGTGTSYADGAVYPFTSDATLYARWTAIPTVGSINPDAGPLSGGTSVTITGTGFYGGGTSSAVSAVDFGTIAVTSYSVSSDTSITATNPSESAGTVDVTVTTPGGTSATSSSDQFSYVIPSGRTPTNVSLSSSANPAAAGAQVTYTASVLPTPDGGTVEFTDSASAISGCEFASLSSGTATCDVAYSSSGTHAIEASYSGDPTFASSTSGTLTEVVKPSVVRVFGEDAIATAIAVSQAQFPDPGSAKAVVLARSDFFSDALAGGPLASKLDAPLLITPGAPLSSSLDPRVLTEIQRVLPVGGTIYALGGDLALSPRIDGTLEGLGYKVTREAGADEYATAVDIAEALGNPATVFETTGTSFYDSVSAVPAAVETQGAILLTEGSTQAPETASYLAAHPTDTRYAIGGPLAAAGADPTATAVYGQDLYGTAEAVAQRFFPHPTTFGSATSVSFTDALVAGPVLGLEGAPMLPVPPSGPLPSAISGYLSSVAAGLAGGTLYGGPLAVGDDVLGELDALL